MVSDVVEVTAIDIAGETLLGPLHLKSELAVQQVRVQLLELQPPVEPYFPWRPQRRKAIDLLLNEQMLDDGHPLQGDTVLTAVSGEIEDRREGLQLEDVMKKIENTAGKCIGLYVHGSWVYSYKTADDVDLLAIVDPENPEIHGYPYPRRHQGGAWQEFEVDTCFGHVQITCIMAEDWFAMLRSMDITAWTCLSLPPCFVLKEIDDERQRRVVLDIPLLCNSVLAFADYKWLTAVLHGFENEKSCKHIYYAFRALEMGAQLAVQGHIADFKAGSTWYQKGLDVLEKIRAMDPRPLGRGGLRKSPKGQDLVQAIFAHDFEQAVGRFCSTLEERQHQPDSTAEAPSAATCKLVNCRHEFTLESIVPSVRKQETKHVGVYFDNDSAHFDALYPVATCPECSKSVRLDIGPRIGDLEKSIHGRPLDGAAISVFVLYSATVVFDDYFYYILAGIPRSGWPEWAKRDPNDMWDGEVPGADPKDSGIEERNEKELRRADLMRQGFKDKARRDHATAKHQGEREGGHTQKHPPRPRGGRHKGGERGDD